VTPWLLDRKVNRTAKATRREEEMSSLHVHRAGIALESLVARLGAKLCGKDATCSADYFDYHKGLYDGVAACLEAMQAKPPTLTGDAAGSPGARFTAYLSRAADMMRRAADDPRSEDPDILPNVAPALVTLLGVIEALFEHLERRDGGAEH
jgi:hypothetical protein